MGHILLVEDDRALARGIEISLVKDEHTVVRVSTVSEAMSRIGSDRFDLWLLDINLPDGSGYELCEHKKDTPVVFITAKDTEEDFLKGFENGCDDYIAKPFSVEVLRQKVLALLRRTAMTLMTESVQYKDMMIDFDRKLVTVKNEVCKLTVKEYRLLEYMVRNRGRVLTRGQLLGNVWDIDEDFVDDNTLSVVIKRLRKKLEPENENSEYIITVFGMGYTFGK